MSVSGQVTVKEVEFSLFYVELSLNLVNHMGFIWFGQGWQVNKIQVKLEWKQQAMDTEQQACCNLVFIPPVTGHDSMGKENWFSLFHCLHLTCLVLLFCSLCHIVPLNYTVAFLDTKSALLESFVEFLKCKCETFPGMLVPSPTFTPFTCPKRALGSFSYTLEI